MTRPGVCELELRVQGERVETSRITQIAAAPPGWRVGVGEVRNVVAWVLVDYSSEVMSYQNVEALDEQGELHDLKEDVLFAPGERTDEVRF